MDNVQKWVGNGQGMSGEWVGNGQGIWREWMGGEWWMYWKWSETKNDKTRLLVVLIQDIWIQNSISDLVNIIIMVKMTLSLASKQYLWLFLAQTIDISP